MNVPSISMGYLLKTGECFYMVMGYITISREGEKIKNELMKALIEDDINKVLRILGMLLEKDIRRIRRWK